MVGHTPAGNTDYGATTTPAREGKLHRPLILASHALHLISSLIVMSIAAYFIAKYRHNTHLRYWVALAAIDVVLFLVALAMSAMRSYKGYLAPLNWIFSYLWLTAFIFAAQDYANGRCHWGNSPMLVDKCGLKRTLAAFAFLAFLTNLIATLLEARLWDVNRHTGPTYVTDKRNVAPVATTTAPHTGV